MKSSVVGVSMLVFFIGLMVLRQSASAALAQRVDPRNSYVLGQENICGKGPQSRLVKLRAEEKIVDIGDGVTTEAWTFNGTSPGPTIEACEGDSIKIVVENKMAHDLTVMLLESIPCILVR